MLTDEQKSALRQASSVMYDNGYPAIAADLDDILAASAAPAESRPSTLGEQIKKAKAEVATWTPERRANVRLQGSDLYAPAEGREAGDERAAFAQYIKGKHPYLIQPLDLQAERDKEMLLGAWQARAALATAPTMSEVAGEPIPRKATPEMLAAFKEAYKQGSIWTDRIEHALTEMLEAAPPHPASEPLTDAARDTIEAARRLIGGGVIRDTAGNGMTIFLGSSSDAETLSRALAEIERIDRANPKEGV